MVRAIQFDRFGGPEVLEYREVTVANPGPGQARVRHTAVGLNFIDVYHRTGLYPLPLPSGNSPTSGVCGFLVLARASARAMESAFWYQ